MFSILSTLIVASSIGAPITVQAPFSDTLEQWVVDNASARVATNDAFERGPDGGTLGDRVLFDLRSRIGDERAMLVVSCLTGRFAVHVEGQHLLREGSTDDWPLAAKLAQDYCARVDDLPAAAALTLI